MMTKKTTRLRSLSVRLARALLAAALALALAPAAALADEPSPASRIVDDMLAANHEAIAEFEATGSMRALMGLEAYGHADGAAPLDNALLPSKYSLVDEGVVTPVKDQSPWGTCWAFGAIAASETSILSELKARGEVVDPSAFDLSERHLAWMSRTPLSDGSSQDGEGTYTFSDDPSVDPLDPSLVMNAGGSAFEATSVLCSGIGPVPERVAPYRNDEGIEDPNGFYSEKGTWAVDQGLRFSQSYQLEEGSVLPPPENNRAEGVAAMKGELLAGRAVAVSFCADSWMPGEPGTSKYLNTDTWAHYTWDGAGANHAACVVGWDDDYSKDNFLAGRRPPGDGAWLVKNSWGAADQEFPNGHAWGVDGNGYFWLSYYDKSLACAETFDYDTAGPSSDLEYWLVEQYDLMPSTGAERAPQDVPTSMANVFAAEERMSVTAVSCETVAPGSKVAFEVYLLDDGCADPADGRLAASFERTYEYGGYHREQLEAPILVEEGQAYSVVITVQVGDECDLLARVGFSKEGVDYINQTLPDGQKFSFYEKGVVNPGESLLYFEDEWDDWADVIELFHQQAAEIGEDLFTYDNFGIKAYGDPAPAPKAVVPDLAGMTEAEALAALEAAGLEGVPGEPEHSDAVGAGRVLRQDVAAGTEVERGSTVAYVLSLGKEDAGADGDGGEGAPGDGAPGDGNGPPSKAALVKTGDPLSPAASALAGAGVLAAALAALAARRRGRR